MNSLFFEQEHEWHLTSYLIRITFYLNIISRWWINAQIIYLHSFVSGEDKCPISQHGPVCDQQNWAPALWEVHVGSKVIFLPSLHIVHCTCEPKHGPVLFLGEQLEKLSHIDAKIFWIVCFSTLYYLALLLKVI